MVKRSTDTDMLRLSDPRPERIQCNASDCSSFRMFRCNHRTIEYFGGEKNGFNHIPNMFRFQHHCSQFIIINLLQFKCKGSVCEVSHSSSFCSPDTYEVIVSCS